MWGTTVHNANGQQVCQSGLVGDSNPTETLVEALKRLTDQEALLYLRRWDTLWSHLWRQDNIVGGTGNESPMYRDKKVHPMQPRVEFIQGLGLKFAQERANRGTSGCGMACGNIHRPKGITHDTPRAQGLEPEHCSGRPVSMGPPVQMRDWSGKASPGRIQR